MSQTTVGSIVAKMMLNIDNFSSNLSTIQNEIEQTGKKLNGLNNLGDGMTAVGKTVTTSLTLPIAGVGIAATTLASDFEYAMSQVKAISGATGDEFKALEDEAIELGGSTKFSATTVADAMTEMAKAGWSTEQILAGMSGVLDAAAASGEGLGTVSTIVADTITGFGMEAGDATTVADLLTQAANAGTIGVAELGESFKYIAPVARSMGIDVYDATTAIAAMSTAGIKGSQAGTSLKNMLVNLVKPTDAMAEKMLELGLITEETQVVFDKDAIEKAWRKADNASINAQKSQIKYNEAVAKYGANSSQAKTAALNYQKAQLAATDAQKELTKAQEGNLEVVGYQMDFLTDSQGNMKDLEDILATLRVAFDGLTEEEKANAAATLAGKEGMAGMLALLNMTQDEYDSISGTMLHSSGVAQETAEVMQDNLASAIEQLGGALESLAIRIGKQLAPVIRSIAESITKFTEKLAGASEGQIKMAIAIGAIVASIGPLLLIGGKLIATFTTIAKFGPTVAKGFTAVSQAALRVKDAFFLARGGFTALASQASPLGAALAGITAPVLAIVAVVGVLVAAFVSLWKNNEEFRNKIKSIWTGIKDMFSNFFGQITEKINSLGFKFESFSEVLKAIWQGLCDFLAPIFIGVFQYISDTIGTVLDVILGVVDFFVSIFKGNWEGAWNAIKDIFVAIWDGMVKRLSNIGNVLLGVLNVILGWFGTSWTEMWTGVKTFFVNLWSGIVEWFQGVLTGISTFFTEIWNGVSTFFQNVWTGITSFFTNAVNSIVSYVQTHFGALIENIRNIFTGVKDFFSGVWELIKNVFTGAVLVIIDLVTGNFKALKTDLSNIWKNIKSAFDTIWKAIQTIFTNAIDAIKNGIKSGMDVIQKTISNVWDAIKTFFTNTLNDIKNTFTNVWNAIKTFIATAVNNIKNTVINTFNSMKSGIATTIGGIKDTIINGFNKAISWIKALPSQAVTWGKDMVQGIIDGITGMIDKVGDAVSGVAEKIRSFLHFSVPDEGPLTDYETYMPDMIEGLTNTLKKAAPQLYRTAEAVASGLSNAFSNPELQTAMAGAYGSVSGGTRYNTPGSTEAVRSASGNSTIYIDKIEVRDDNDIEELTQGLYNHNDKSLRAMGRRNL